MRIKVTHAESTMADPYDRAAPKRATNLSVNSDLLRRARELDVNLSATLERALADEVRRRQRDAWLDENRAAIDAYNDAVEKHGTFADTLRRF
jgi:antitoxin CcdA